MVSLGGEIGVRFFRTTLAWSAGLVALALAYHLFTGFPHLDVWSPWGVAFLLANLFGLFIPYAAFAGGVTTSESWSPRPLVLRSLLLAILSYGLLAYAAPAARYQLSAATGEELAVRYPFGPETPGGIKALRSVVEADPPDAFAFSTDRPTLQPPNWLTYRLHSLVATALFAVLAALLGWQAGHLTTGLSPPARENAQWALGLLTAAVFFLAEASTGNWVRLDPSHSGLAGAWTPLVVAALEFALLPLLARWLQRRLHALTGPLVL